MRNDFPFSINVYFVSLTKGGRYHEEKLLFFCILSQLPTPPPPFLQFGQIVQLFSDVKIQDFKVSLELKTLYILYNILYICNLKKQLKVRYIGIFEEIDSFC